MHRARLLGGEPDVPPRHRSWLLLAWLAPWLWLRALDGSAQKEARRQQSALLHLGPLRLVIHLPEASHSVPWRRVAATRDGPAWRIDAAGLHLSVVAEHLSTNERRRLEAAARESH